MATRDMLTYSFPSNSSASFLSKKRKNSSSSLVSWLCLLLCIILSKNKGNKMFQCKNIEVRQGYKVL